MSPLSNTSDNWKYFELLCQNVQFSVLSELTFLIRRTLFFHIQPILSRARFRTKKKLAHLFWTLNSDKYEDIFTLPVFLCHSRLRMPLITLSIFRPDCEPASAPARLCVLFEEVERDRSEMELRWIASSPLLSGFMQMDLSLGSPSGRRCLSFLLLQIQRYPSYQSSQNNVGCPCAPFEVVSSCRVAGVGTIWGRLVWD